MPKLVVKINGALSGEIDLRPGVNRIGRNEDNDFSIPHPSLSGNHCEIYWEDSALFIRDLDSTNGTFIDGQRITETYFQLDQVLSLGSVELLADHSIPASNRAGLRVAKVEEAPTVAQAVPVQATPNLSQYPRVSRSLRETGFFGQLPASFMYPFKQDGLTLLIGGTAAFAFLEFLQTGTRFVLGGILGLFFIIWLGILVFGYLAAFMQKIITSSANGDEEMPDWPEFSDFGSSIVHPALLVAGSFAASFGPAIAFWLMVDMDPDYKLMIGLGLVVFGCFYLPLALIATAIYDSLFALTPLLIVPSMIRAAKEYIVVCLFLGIVIGVRVLTELLLNFLLPIAIIPTILSTFIALYFIVVEMRVLGLFYYFKKDDLAWSF